MFRIILFCFIFTTTNTLFAQDRMYYNYIENKGQWPDDVRYKCDLESGNLFLEDDGIRFDFWDISEVTNLHANPKADEIIKENPPEIRGHVYDVRFIGSSVDSKTIENKKTIEYYNYFLGNDESKWAGECYGFGEITYNNLYPGIDLKMYSKDFFLKYDFIVAPQADASVIRMKYEGQDNIKLDNDRLIITLSVNEIIEQKPLAWQIIKGEKVFIICKYELNQDELSFKFPKGYNKNYELIIDPELIFSTYSGSTANNFGYTATYDSDGFLYSGSSAFGAGYPTETGAYQDTWAGGVGAGTLVGTDMAITKYDTTGTFRIYSTYLGGTGDDLPHSLVVNDTDELYVYGTTSSDDFPAFSFDSIFGGGDQFNTGGVGVDYTEGSDIVVSKLNIDGSVLLKSTYLGGSENDGLNEADELAFNYADQMRGEILIDTDQNVYIVSSTFSADFPILNGFQTVLSGGQDGCIVKMDPDLETILWSSFIGGNSNDAAYSVALDSNNDIYVCGGTSSTNLPVTLGAIQTSNNGGAADGYIVKIDQDGSNIIASSYYGSPDYDQLYFVEVDNNDEVYVYGQTLASDNYFISNATYSQPNSGMLVSKFNNLLSTVSWSTVFGTSSGKVNLSPTAFLVDVCNRVYMSGWGGNTNTSSSGAGTDADLLFGMDISDDAYQSSTDGSDFYLLVIESDASEMIYATFFGGGVSAEHVDGGTSRFSPDGTIYQSVCAGCGGNDDFPIHPTDAVSSVNGNSCNNGVFKMEFGFPAVTSVFEAPSIYCENIPIFFNNTSEFGTEYTWNFGDGSDDSNEENPIHLYPGIGTYDIELTAYNELCDITEISMQTIEIIASTSDTEDVADICSQESEVMGPDTIYDNYEYTWLPDLFLSDATSGNPLVTPENNMSYILLIHHDGCVDTMYQDVTILHPSLQLPNDTIICEETILNLEAITLSGSSMVWSDISDFSNELSIENNLDITIDDNLVLYGSSEWMGCVAIDTMNISFLSQSVTISADFTACANDTITLQVLNPDPLLTYHWEPESLVLTGQNTTQATSILEQLTTYTLVANYLNLCSVSDEVTVDISGVDTNAINATATPSIILSGDNSQLETLPNNLTYTWTPAETIDNPNTSNPIASPDETTTYFVTISDGNCSYNNSVKVTVTDFICGNPTIYIPNAFTPNSNGQNEKVFVRGNNLTSIYLTIYDRWGEKMFETTNQEIGWDGTYKGEDLDPAVFVYYLEAICADGQEYFEKGNITLIR